MDIRYVVTNITGGSPRWLYDSLYCARGQADAVLVCDGAGWHQRGKKLQVSANITLLSLPPYSPELNPMETVWDYLRQTNFAP